MAGQLPDEGMESDAMTLGGKDVCRLESRNTLESLLEVKLHGETRRLRSELIKSVKSLVSMRYAYLVPGISYIEDGGTYKVKDEWLNRVYEVVGYCVSNDMYAICKISTGMDGWLENNCTADKQEANNKKQKALMDSDSE